MLSCHNSTVLIAIYDSGEDYRKLQSSISPILPVNVLFGQVKIVVLIEFFVSLVTTHFANCVLEHGVLLIEVVYRNLVLCVVVHRRLQEER